MEMKAAIQRCRQIGRTDPPSVFYALGADGDLMVGPGTLPGCPHDIRVDYRDARGRVFPPDHNRYFDDLDFRRRQNRPAFAAFMLALEAVYEGRCPLQLAQTLESRNVHFPGVFYPTAVYLGMSQLFMVEQDINYGPGGRRTLFDPPREFHMNYLRWVAEGTHPVDTVKEANRKLAIPPLLPAFGSR